MHKFSYHTYTRGMPMQNLAAVLFFVSILLPAAFAEVDFTTCLANVRTGSFGTVGGRDNRGNPVDISNATAITYELSLSACGAGQEPFQWFVFSQQFSSWLLPWLALVSQLPFGSNRKLDNLESALLTVGSPALAAYSLALTVLNRGWIALHFKKFTYPNARRAIRIFTGLQQAPLRVVKNDALLASLVVLPQNDEWWIELDRWLNDTNTWSISAVTSISWVIIAYIFTVVNSFTGNLGTSIQTDGQAVGSLWLWLLPIIIGWLMISPKCDSTQLSNAIEKANQIAHVVTENGDIVLAKSRSEECAVEFTIEEVDSLTCDEKRTAPIYNYARFLPWVQAVDDVFGAFHGAWDHYRCPKTADSTIDRVIDQNQKPRERICVGKKAQVEDYCRDPRGLTTRSRWGPDVFSRMAIASILAMMLQWGTVGAAFVVAWFTPTVGLGCRSASYLIYGFLSTIVWIMLVSSSILTHYANMPPPHHQERATMTSSHRQKRQVKHWSRTAARLTSIFLRRLGKMIAALNSVWIFVSCMFQLSNFYDRCYCNSNALWLRSNAYNVIELVIGDLMRMKFAWIGGVCLAAGVVVLYVGFINLFIDPALPDQS